MPLQQVEVVKRPFTRNEGIAYIPAGALSLALRVLVVWWFFATWFPQLGYTYWQLVLPVFAVRFMLSGFAWHPRRLDK